MPSRKKSQLTKLCPRFDEDGCLEDGSNGRLRFVEFPPYEVRYP